MAEPKHEFLLLRTELQRVLGEYRPGAIPVINNPNDPDVMAVLHHEQCHQAVIGDTLYGYLLSRLFELTNDKRQPANVVALFTPIRDDILSMALATLEGHATFCEIVYFLAKTGSAEALGVRFNKLSPFYQAAAHGFWPCFDAGRGDQMLQRLLATAVTEYALDRPLLDVLATSPATFPDWITTLANGGIGPDHFTEEAVQALGSLQLTDIFGTFGSDTLDPRALDENRLTVDRIKTEIKKALYDRDPGDGRALLNDALARVRGVIDADLTGPHLRNPLSPFTSTFRDMVVTRPPANEWYVDEVEVPPRQFFERLERELHSDRWACIILSGMSLEGSDRALPLQALPLRYLDSDRGTTLALGDSFYTMATSSDFLIADAMIATTAPEHTAWFNLGLPDPRVEGRLINHDYFLSMKARTILHCPFAGPDVLRLMAKVIPGVTFIDILDIDDAPGLEVVIVNGKALTLMYMAPRGHTAETMTRVPDIEGVTIRPFIFPDTGMDLRLAGALHVLLRSDQPSYEK